MASCELRVAKLPEREFQYFAIDCLLQQTGYSIRQKQNSKNHGSFAKRNTFGSLDVIADHSSVCYPGLDQKKTKGRRYLGAALLICVMIDFKLTRQEKADTRLFKKALADCE